MAKKKAPGPVAAYEYAVIQVVTIAKFRRPRNPQACVLKRFHIFQWRSPERIALDDLVAHIPKGTKCQCGALEH